MQLSDVYPFLVEQVSHNQFLTGATLTGFLAGLVYTVKGWALKIYYRAKGFFRVSITIHSEDALYLPVSQWLYEHGFDKFSRTYRIRYINHKAVRGPAEGTFTFLYAKKFLGVTIAKDAQPAGGGGSWGRSQTKETLTLSYYSATRSQAILDTVLDAAVEACQDTSTQVSAWVYHTSWTFATHIPKRKTPTVILKDNDLELLEKDIEQFLARKDWYTERGVPYHRGYLLTGPPGTGKTSLVRHLAQKFNLALHVSDGSMRSINSVPPKSILLLEDVDSISKMRSASLEMLGKKAPGEPASIASSIGSSSSSGDDNFFAPTLSELLNALDGVISAEDVVVVMTTNHPEMLDPAVIRPGRVDYRLHLGECTPEQASRLFTKFYGEKDLPAFKLQVTKRVYTPAQLQELFITAGTSEGVMARMAQA